MGNIIGYPTAPIDPSVGYIPTEDFFITWPQRGAMFKLTRHKAARLFLAWVTGYEHQVSWGSWSVREDVRPPQGLKPLESYQNTDPLKFIVWMRDRKHIHQLRMKMQAVFGPVQGQSPLTDPDLLRLYYMK